MGIKPRISWAERLRARRRQGEALARLNVLRAPPAPPPAELGEPAPPGSFCAQCLADGDGAELRLEDRDGRRIAVCGACRDEHPRSGRYGFEDSPAAAVRPLGGRVRD